MIEPADNPTTSRLSSALADIVRAYPLERKLLVCARPAHGRELLRGLAQHGVVWAGFDIMTPQQVAHSVVAPDIALEGLRITDEFDELALLDDAMDEVLGPGTEGLAELAEGVGLRQAVVHAVRALRLADVGEAALERARFRDEHKRSQIAQILAAYERRLSSVDAALIDSAGVLRRAVSALAVGSAALPYDKVWILPGQSRRGLSGKLLDVLLERGATILPTDPVHGLRPPSHVLHRSDGVAGSRLSWVQAPGDAPADTDAAEVAIFAASSMASELREVLRRVTSAGLRWDEVEIIATDANAYGVALDALARRLDIPVSYAVGLPVSRTRPGRAVAKYLEWIQSDFPPHLLREMLERGDIAPPEDSGTTAVAAARLLRRLKVGRGRDQYMLAIERRARILSLPQSPDDERSPGEFAESRARDRRELDALRQVVEPLLSMTPRLTTTVADAAALVAPSSVASGLVALLQRVPTRHTVDRTAHDRLLDRVQRIAGTLHRRTSLESAIAIVMSKLDDRVPAPEEPGSAPWTASGGYLHLSDLDHGGFSGRPATFIVGLDAARFPGGRYNDALLVDDDRRRIIGAEGGAALPLSGERIEERRWLLSALVARLRGRVTFSYAAWDAVEGRAVAPASELLQVHRLLSGNAAADYDELHAALSPAASPIPHGGGAIDDADVWFGTLSSDGRLRSGVSLVYEIHPHLKEGVAAFRERQGAEPSTRHGVIQPRPQLDPRDNGAIVSATQLQALGTCPHRYLLRYVLGVRAPDDPELSSEEWLSPLERGSLMHRVYERSLSAARDENIVLTSDAFEDRVLRILEEEAESRREVMPPPGEGIYRMECELLREDARAFVAMVRDDGDNYIELEKKFGRDGADPVSVTLPDGRALNVAGAIDRLDRTEDGRLVVIDYKTGSRARFGARNGAFDGGRRLQHVLYAAVARTLLGADVERAEFHFPTRASENYRAIFGKQDLADGLAVIGELLDLAASGMFVPTNDPDDCTYCDFAAVCRVKPGSYGRCRSPMAEWARDVDSDVMDLLRRLRR